MNRGECKASGLINNYHSNGSTSSSLWLASQFCFIGLMAVVIMILSHYMLQKRVQPTTSLSRKQQRRRRRRRDLYSFQRRRDRLSFSEELHDCSDRDQPFPSSQHNAEDDFDLYDRIPKNSNWRHFELNQEEEEGSNDRTKTTATVPQEGDNEAESSASSSSEAFLWTQAGGARRRQRRRDKFQSHQTPPRTMTWLDKFRHSFHGNSEDDAKPLHGNSEDDDDDDDALASSSGDISWEESLRHDDNDMDIYCHDGNHGDDKKPRPERITTPRTSITTNSIWQKNRSDKARYNAKIMPNKLIMIRHGQSEGNVNEALYSTTPDNAMRLTQLGWDQARQAGQVLKQRVILTGEPVHFIVSPYVRTVETFHGIVSAWCDPKEFSHIRNRERRLKAWYGRLLELGLTWHEDPRIREQDFGNYQVPDNIRLAKQERHRFGPFFYRFAHGESASDVFDRVSTFLDSLWRSFDHNQAKYYVLVTHGISIRVLLARYFRYSIDQFSHLANPRNCEMIVLAHDGAGKLKLDGRFEVLEEKEGENANSVRKVKGYTFHERLRVLPKEYVHKLNARISYDDPLTSMDDKEPTIHENGG